MCAKNPPGALLRCTARARATCSETKTMHVTPFFSLRGSMAVRGWEWGRRGGRGGMVSAAEYTIRSSYMCLWSTQEAILALSQNQLGAAVLLPGVCSDAVMACESISASKYVTCNMWIICWRTAERTGLSLHYSMVRTVWFVLPRGSKKSTMLAAWYCPTLQHQEPRTPHRRGTV
jgi:hypothetical protein